MRYLSILIFLAVKIVSAQLSPGDLNKVHADLEGVKNCTQCHESGQQLSIQKCLDCHTLLNAEIKNDKGFHANPDNRQCEKCHVEHQGRNFELIYWKNGKDAFDHTRAGYKLEGAHKGLDCNKCHMSKNIKDPQKFLAKKKDLEHTYLGLDQACLSCHYDEHRGQMNTTCLDCHSFEKWKPAAKFDHNKTDYPLTGRHKEIDCVKCHALVTDHKFADDADFMKFIGFKFGTCQNCHHDVHNNRFGSNCQKCHNTTGWANYAENEFNHNQTRFPLKGKHSLIKCSSCHTVGNKLRFKGFNTCQDCHKDYHQGQFRLTDSEGKCERCHDVKGFSPALFTIDQHNKSPYPLEGAHLAVPCFLCHTKINHGTIRETMQFRFKSTRCNVCHKDAHQGTVNKYLNLKSSISKMDGCEHCHQVSSWADVNFDHTQTAFTLEGRHLSTPCIGCHKQGKGNIEIVFNTAPKECMQCHQDKHAGQFATDVSKMVTNCRQCHTPASWKAEKFDHNRDAAFKLTGAHQSVACNQCHKTISENGIKFVQYKPLSSECKSCHGSTIN